jgi:NAD(P)-dependent dehydrogenase (short-subunit alcohol dehydrogenase family)
MGKEPKMLLADRVAIITGGAKGIGRGIALKFAQEGCRVVIADIDQRSAEATLAEVTQKGGKGIALACDAFLGAQAELDVVVRVTV